MRSIPVVASLLMLAAHAVLPAAAQGFDPAARARQIERFIDEQTVAIVHADISRIELDALHDKLIELIPGASSELNRARQELSQFEQGLQTAGVSEIYLVISLADLPQSPPVVIAPLPEQASVEPLLSMIPERYYPFHERVGDALVLASAAAGKRLKALAPDPRPELANAFRAAGDTAVQLLLLPPAYSRRVIEELMPTLPEVAGGGPSTILSRGMLWAAVGIDLPPQMQLRVVIQSEDQQAAETLLSKWRHVVETLSTHPRTRQRFGDFDKVARLLTPRVETSRLVLTLSQQDGSIDALLAALRPPIEAARARAQRLQSSNNLKQLALAMHNYHDVYKTFPPVGSTDADGRPLLSWRVHILPFLGHQQLYKQFHLDEPWDSPHNRQLIEKMPDVFRCPASKLTQNQGLSTYRVVSGEGTVFPPGTGITLRDIKDGTSNTIMIVEVDDEHAVIWTKPEGLPFAPANPHRGVGGQFKGGFNAAFCDGSVRFIPETIAAETLKALLTRDGGEVIPPSSEW